MKYHVLKHLKVNPFRKDTFHHSNYVDYIKKNFKKKRDPSGEERSLEIKPAKEEEGSTRFMHLIFFTNRPNIS
jgi:hypothetical protein